MIGNFIAMVYAVLKDNGIDTKGMSTEEAVEKYNELVGKSGRYDTEDGESNKKMTPTEKIASVHIDPNKDNILPELNDTDLEKLGISVNKQVLLKKSIIDRNEYYHSDIDESETNKIIGEALYNPAKIFKGNKDGYFIFAQVVRVSSKNGEPRYGTVLLDVNETLKNFEIVHWHIMIPKELERAENKNK